MLPNLSMGSSAAAVARAALATGAMLAAPQVVQAVRMPAAAVRAAAVRVRPAALQAVQASAGKNEYANGMSPRQPLLFVRRQQLLLQDLLRNSFRPCSNTTGHDLPGFRVQG